MLVDLVIVFVSDMPRSISFYRDVVGLPLKFESPHWTEFATDAATLALHLSEEDSSADGEQKLEAAGQCRPGFKVPNLDEFHEKMIANDVPCIQEPQELFGSRLAQYKDPDGLAFSVGEQRFKS